MIEGESLMLVSNPATDAIANALERLQVERERIDMDITQLKMLQADIGSALGQYVPKKSQRSTKGWTPDKRRAAAERMRRYWIERRNQRTVGGINHD